MVRPKSLTPTGVKPMIKVMRARCAARMKEMILVWKPIARRDARTISNMAFIFTRVRTERLVIDTAHSGTALDQASTSISWEMPKYR